MVPPVSIAARKKVASRIVNSRIPQARPPYACTLFRFHNWRNRTGASLNRIFGWLVEASPQQKRTLLAASLGWMLDSMDVMLYALVLGQVQRAMHLSAAMSGAVMWAGGVSAR